MQNGSLQQKTKLAADSLTQLLVQMYRQGRLKQWIAYFLEALENDIGKDALEQTLLTLEERYKNGCW